MRRDRQTLTVPIEREIVRLQRAEDEADWDGDRRRALAFRRQRAALEIQMLEGEKFYVSF